MIKIILTIIVAFLIGCKPNPLPEPKFHYGDVVTFKEGFYKGSKGTVVGIWGWHDKGYYVYTIEMRPGLATNQSEFIMEIKNENSN